MECTTGEPSLFVSDTHINTRRYGIKTVNVVQMNLHDNLFYATLVPLWVIRSYVGVYVLVVVVVVDLTLLFLTTSSIMLDALVTDVEGYWYGNQDNPAIIADNVFYDLRSWY